MENDSNFTHAVLSYPSNDVEILGRISDGMLIGQRKSVTVVFGEGNKGKDSRVFLDEVSASRYLRGKVALDDLKARGIEGPVLIEERAGSIIEIPAGVMELPNPGIARMN